MQKMTERLGIVVGVLLMVSHGAYAGPIDLRDFYADPFFAGSISLGGSSAETSTALLTDETVGFAALINDPFFDGDPPGRTAPTINSGPDGLETSLTFEFDFDTVAGSAEFVVELFELEDDGTLTFLEETFYALPQMNTLFEFDIGADIGNVVLQFSLLDLDFDPPFDVSSVLISNLMTSNPNDPGGPPAQVPEPGSLMLMLCGLFALGVKRRVGANPAKFTGRS